MKNINYQKMVASAVISVFLVNTAIAQDSTSAPNDNTAQPETAAKPSQQAVDAIVEAPPPGILPGILIDGTDVLVTLGEPISSKTTTVGSTVAFFVSNDVKLGEDIAIPKGSTGQATVTEVRKRGSFGKAGIIALQFNYLTLKDGQKIELSSGVVQNGKKTLNLGDSTVSNLINSGSALAGAGGVGIASAGLVAVGFLIKGDQAEIPTEAVLTAKVKGNTAINALLAAKALPADLAPANVEKNIAVPAGGDTGTGPATTAVPTLPGTTG